MKITVGQLLIVVGVGTYVVLGPLRGVEKGAATLDKARSLAAEKLPYINPDGAKTSVKSPAAVADIAPADRLPAGEVSPVADNFSEVPLTPVPAKDDAFLDEVSVPQPTAETAPPVVAEEKPAAKPVARRKRRTPKTVAAPAKPAATRKSSAKKADALVGTYVALTLKTGNVVKGVLLEKTASNYKIELPGMGGFDYPADSVKTVAAAE